MTERGTCSLSLQPDETMRLCVRKFALTSAFKKNARFRVYNCAFTSARVSRPAPTISNLKQGRGDVLMSSSLCFCSRKKATRFRDSRCALTSAYIETARFRICKCALASARVSRPVFACDTTRFRVKKSEGGECLRPRRSVSAVGRSPPCTPPAPLRVSPGRGCGV